MKSVYLFSISLVTIHFDQVWNQHCIFKHLKKTKMKQTYLPPQFVSDHLKSQNLEVVLEIGILRDKVQKKKKKIPQKNFFPPPLRFTVTE